MFPIKWWIVLYMALILVESKVHFFLEGQKPKDLAVRDDLFATQFPLKGEHPHKILLHKYM